MPLSVLALVLLAALMHASWNAIVKGAGDPLLTAILFAGFGGVIAAVGLPFLVAPAMASWPFLVASSVLQMVYFVLLARSYAVLDMSQAYPMTRGAAPLIVATASGLVIGERLSPAAWGGVLLISCGIFGLALAAHRGGGRRTALLPLANAVVIASYTIVDGLGVRRSGSPWGYTLWLDVLPAIPLISWALARRREAFLHHASTRLGIGLVGGAGSLLSYGLALWAMTLAPVALVAALRESSMLFATAISAFILREPVGRGRVAMVCFVVAGVAVLRLA